MRAVYGMILVAVSTIGLTAQADHWSELKSVSYAYVSSVEHFREELEDHQAHPYVVQTAYRLERDARDIYNMSRGRCDVDRLLFTHREVIDGHRRLVDVVNQSCRSDRHLMRDFEAMECKFNELNEVIRCIQRGGVSGIPSPAPSWPSYRPGYTPGYGYPPGYSGHHGLSNPYGNVPGTIPGHGAPGHGAPGYGLPGYGVPGYGTNLPSIQPASPHDMFRTMQYEMMRAMLERSRR